MDFESIVREFVQDVEAAYGGNGQSSEEIAQALKLDTGWNDLGVTYRKAVAALEAKDR